MCICKTLVQLPFKKKKKKRKERKNKETSKPLVQLRKTIISTFELTILMKCKKRLREQLGPKGRIGKRPLNKAEIGNFGWWID